jgi:hypothetical protein
MKRQMGATQLFGILNHFPEEALVGVFCPYATVYLAIFDNVAVNPSTSAVTCVRMFGYTYFYLAGRTNQ